MTRFEEESLAFDFGERWQVTKYDATEDYRHRLEIINGTKAVDFVGVLDGRKLYLIEVKDFRTFRIENKTRLQSGELAQKVRDSVAGLIGFYRTKPETWQHYGELLRNINKPVKVVLWLEHDLPAHPIQRKKALASVQANLFKQKLTWLTSRVLVCSLEREGLIDVTVSNLSRPT
jgi:hypothetical protein